jgi:hypothetical protein
MNRAKAYLTGQVAVPRWFLLLVLIVFSYEAVHDDPLWFAVAYFAALALVWAVSYRHHRRDDKRTA